jgi:uncharacterized protein (TIGR02598 family)
MRVKNPSIKTLTANRAQGFTLVEVALAVGIVAFAALPVTGLLAIGLNSTYNSVQGSEGAQIATAIVSDLRASAQGPSATVPASVSRIYQIPMVAGNHEIYLDALGIKVDREDLSAAFRLAVKITAQHGFSAPSEMAPVSQATLLLTWPASALPENAIGRLEMAASFTSRRAQ